MRRAVAWICVVILLVVAPGTAAADGDLINYGLLAPYGGSAACQYYSDYAGRFFDGLTSSSLGFSYASVWVTREWTTSRTLVGVKSTIGTAVSMRKYSLRVEAWVSGSWVTVLNLASVSWNDQAVKPFASAVETTMIRLTYIADATPWTLQDIGLMGELAGSLNGIPSAASVRLLAENLTPPLNISRDGTHIGSTSTLEYFDADYPPGVDVVYSATDANNKTASVSVTTCPAGPVVTVGSTTTSTIRLAWASVNSATKYRIYRGGAFLVEVQDLHYTDGNLSPNTTFTYEVSAVNTSGEGRRSAPVTASTSDQPPPPQAPTGLRVTSRYKDGIGVAWDVVPGVGGYKVYLNGVLKTLTAQTSAFLSGLTAGTQYSVTVQAYTGIYDGALSDPLLVSTIGVPGQVANLGVTAGAVTLNVSWQAPVQGDAPTSYNVYLDGILKGTTAATSYLVTGLTPATEYTVAVAGVNDAGEGSPVQVLATTTNVQVPDPVTGLVGSATVRTITVTWDAYPGAVRYQVLLDSMVVGETSLDGWTFTGLAPDTTYTVGVAAVNEAGAGMPATVNIKTQSGVPVISKVAALGSGYVVTYHGPQGVDAPDAYMIWADDVLRTTAVIPSQYPDPDMGWNTGTNHTIRVEAIYGSVTASASATVTAYVAADPVDYPPPTGIFEAVLQNWAPILVLVTALSCFLMLWDWWLTGRPGRRDPIRPPGGGV